MSEKKKGRPTKPKEIKASGIEDTVKEIAIQKRNNSPVIGDNGMLVQGDEKRQLTARLLTETLATYNMPKVTSDAELEQRFADYFQHCAETGEKPTVEQMAQCTGYTVATLWDWENGRNKGFSSATSDISKKAKEFLRVFDAKLLMEGALNPVSYIFRAKNYYGMKDVQDYVVTPNNPLGAEGDPNALAQKYRQALPEGIEAESVEKE